MTLQELYLDNIRCSNNHATLYMDVRLFGAKHEAFYTIHAIDDCIRLLAVESAGGA